MDPTLTWLLLIAAVVLIIVGAMRFDLLSITWHGLSGSAPKPPHNARLTQQHRGLSAALLGGNESVQAARDAKNTEVVKQFADVDGMLADNAVSDAMRATWQDARQRWKSLSGQVDAKGLKAAESSSLH